MLEKQFGHKQKQKDEDEVVEEKTLLHSELQEPNELPPSSHFCSEADWAGSMYSCLVVLGWELS